MLCGDCALLRTVKLLTPAEHLSLKVVLAVGTLTCFLMGRGHRRIQGMTVCVIQLPWGWLCHFEAFFIS